MRAPGRLPGWAAWAVCALYVVVKCADSDAGVPHPGSTRTHEVTGALGGEGGGAGGGGRGRGGAAAASSQSGPLGLAPGRTRGPAGGPGGPGDSAGSRDLPSPEMAPPGEPGDRKPEAGKTRPNDTAPALNDPEVGSAHALRALNDQGGLYRNRGLHTQCSDVGQLLRDVTSHCHYIVCQHASLTFKATHNAARFSTRRMPCAPGTHVEAGYTGTGPRGLRTPCSGTGHICPDAPNDISNESLPPIHTLSAPAGKKAAALPSMRSSLEHMRHLVRVLRSIVKDEVKQLNNDLQHGRRDPDLLALDAEWVRMKREVARLLSLLSVRAGRGAGRDLRGFSTRIMSVIIRLLQLNEHGLGSAHGAPRQLPNSIDPFGGHRRGDLKMAGAGRSSSPAPTAGYDGEEFRHLDNNRDVQMMDRWMALLQKDHGDSLGAPGGGLAGYDGPTLQLVGDAAYDEYGDAKMLDEFHKGMSGYDSSSNEFHKGMSGYDSDSNEFHKGMSGYDSDSNEFHKGMSGYDTASNEFHKGNLGYDSASNEFHKGMSGYDTSSNKFHKGMSGYDSDSNEFHKGKSGYDTASNKFHKGMSGYDTASNEFHKGMSHRHGAHKGWRLFRDTGFFPDSPTGSASGGNVYIDDGARNLLIPSSRKQRPGISGWESNNMASSRRGHRSPELLERYRYTERTGEAGRGGRLHAGFPDGRLTRVRSGTSVANSKQGRRAEMLKAHGYGRAIQDNEAGRHHGLRHGMGKLVLRHGHAKQGGRLGQAREMLRRENANRQAHWSRHMSDMQQEQRRQWGSVFRPPSLVMSR